VRLTTSSWVSVWINGMASQPDAAGRRGCHRVRQSAAWRPLALVLFAAVHLCASSGQVYPDLEFVAAMVRREDSFRVLEDVSPTGEAGSVLRGIGMRRRGNTAL
jgi:hypothetical protein